MENVENIRYFRKYRDILHSLSHIVVMLRNDVSVLKVTSLSVSVSFSVNRFYYLRQVNKVNGGDMHSHERLLVFYMISVSI